MKTCVLYHADCLDGIASAAIAYKFLKKNYLDEDLLFIPVKHQESPPQLPPNSIVYILDFSYPRETLLDLMEDHIEVWVLDHHISAKEQLSGFKNAFFNLEESGATMTWRYFFVNEPVPYTIQMIKDRDLWQWKLPDTKPFTEAVYNLLDMDVVTWQRLLTPNCVDKDNLGQFVTDLINQGKVIVATSKKQVERQMKKVYWSKLPQHDDLIPMINSDHLISETCQAMYETYPKAPYVVMWSLKDDKVYVSLRSQKETGTDVSKIAKVYGGGGHYHSAGATIPLNQWFNF